MKLLVALFMITVMSACAPERNGPVAGSSPAPVPGPAPSHEPQWGELSCQKNQNCRSLALNQRLERLLDFLARDFASDAGGDFAIYACGRSLGRTWQEMFGDSGFDSSLDDFFVHMFDPNDCRLRPRVRENLDNYFKNQQEYLNETH